ncbi:DUF4412 domain-containing protein [Sediminibacterium sp.]|uniref:DUF4412 domain-containing protein n=1 Tax=Sediminibacterium sp. TaxID=1917865 RepID=UPI00271B9FAE|nr:DUF4412 domain-containing protein [Sediminibacterium sp.]MDO9000374.1 DUF4412 domain-containing protein [Bacteroidota bacterium]MDP3147057.1 DUF4412 domain-containing protein [Bacteroidota bacterium]MDP3567407.1 DUF4412 domain-containing protein [Sediminibacterium sp.]
MKKILFALTLYFGIFQSTAQNFNGSIEFKYTTQKDTTTNIYLVKDKLIKLDQYGKKTNAIEGSFIFDLNASTIKFVNPKRKVWGEHSSETPPIIKGVCTVTKGAKTKSIQGLKCVEYTVSNTDENTTITYWVAENKFSFFVPVIKLWNRKDKQSIYFNQIADLAPGSMPLLSEEKQINDNKLITRLEVVKIGHKAPDDASLAVPPNYNKFDQ